MSYESYPLSWPPGWKRTPADRRTNGKFKSGNKAGLTVAVAAGRLLDELERMGISPDAAILSTNVRPTLSGVPRSGERKPTDPGAAVYWPVGKGHRVMAIDQYTDVAQNLAALAATLEAMRAIERHGGAVILERAFTGFTALPAPEIDWRRVLGVSSRECDLSLVETAYLRLRSQTHPDHGGDANEFSRVQRAWEMAREELA